MNQLLSKQHDSATSNTHHATRARMTRLLFTQSTVGLQNTQTGAFSLLCTHPHRKLVHTGMMMADASQTRIFGKVDGQFLHARWRLWTPILDAQTLLHFGQAKVWVENDWDAARSVCLFRLSFAASCLSASNLRLAFLTDERQLSRSEASCCHD